MPFSGEYVINIGIDDGYFISTDMTVDDYFQSGWMMSDFEVLHTTHLRMISVGACKLRDIE